MLTTTASILFKPCCGKWKCVGYNPLASAAKFHTRNILQASENDVKEPEVPQPEDKNASGNTVKSLFKTCSEKWKFVRYNALASVAKFHTRNILQASGNDVKKPEREVTQPEDKNANGSTVEKKPDFYFGESDLANLAKTKAFVDKSLLIKEFFEASSVRNLITAPRRFGKSANMNLLKKFAEIEVDKDGNRIRKVNQDKSTVTYIDKSTGTYTDNYKMFNELLICKHHNKFFAQHFGQYPVIHIDFKHANGSSFDEILQGFRFVLNETYLEHAYLLESKIWSEGKLDIDYFIKYYNTGKSQTLTRKEIESGLKFLSRCLYKHFEKEVIVLIDEYDAPINNSMFKKNVDIGEVNELLCEIFSQTLKGNNFVGRGLLTGISYFATVGLSGVNNIEKHMFLDDHQFVPYYGLTVAEVEKLFHDFNITDPTKLDAAKLHYNGYLSINLKTENGKRLKGITLYSMWSILKFLRADHIGNYWQESGMMTNLKEALHIPTIRRLIDKLCLGQSIHIKIIKTINMSHIIQLKNICEKKETLAVDEPHVYMNFLLQQGYLTFDDQVDDRYKVKIPNKEILCEFRDLLLSLYGPKAEVYTKECGTIFSDITCNSDDEFYNKFINSFNQILDAERDQCLKHNEDSGHSMMVAVLLVTKLKYATEFPFSRTDSSDTGVADLIILKDKLGIIIEVKRTDSVYKPLKKTRSRNKPSKQTPKQKYVDEALSQIESLYAKPFAATFKEVKDKIYIGLNVNVVKDGDDKVVRVHADLGVQVHPEGKVKSETKYYPIIKNVN